VRSGFPSGTVSRFMNFGLNVAKWAGPALEIEDGEITAIEA
jgi:hypothetical protein